MECAQRTTIIRRPPSKQKIMDQRALARGLKTKHCERCGVVRLKATGFARWSDGRPGDLCADCDVFGPVWWAVRKATAEHRRHIYRITRTREQRQEVRRRQRERSGLEYRRTDEVRAAADFRRAENERDRPFIEMRKTWRAWQALCNADDYDRRNREKYKKRYAARREQEIARAKAAKFLRRAAKVSEGVSGPQIESIRKKATHCVYCGAGIAGRVHLDHFHPVSAGGSSGPDNLVPACRRCNLRKRAKVPGKWSVFMDTDTGARRISIERWSDGSPSDVGAIRA